MVLPSAPGTRRDAGTNRIMNAKVPHVSRRQSLNIERAALLKEPHPLRGEGQSIILNLGTILPSAHWDLH